MSNKNNKSKKSNNKGGDVDDILNFINNSSAPAPTSISINKQPIDNSKNEKSLFDEKIKILNRLFEENNITVAKPTATTTKGKFTPKPVQSKKPAPVLHESSDITFFNNAKNYLQIIKEKELPLETLLKLNKTSLKEINKPSTKTTTANNNNSGTKDNNYGYIDPKKIKVITDEEAIQLFKLFSKTKNEVGRIFIAYQFFIFIQNKRDFDKNEYSSFISKVILDESPLVNYLGKKIMKKEEGGKTNELSECNSLVLNQVYSSIDKLQIIKSLPESSPTVQFFKENIKTLLNLTVNPKDSSNGMNLLASVLFYQKIFENSPPTSSAQLFFLDFYYSQLKIGLTLSTYYCDVVDKKIEDLAKFNHLNEDQGNPGTTSEASTTNNTETIITAQPN
ncbi:hypothetical protein DICPUDRAFT_159040 [Dictyostelium purpureum]|uniref:Uncharacterized protein n=1 Tax=Dictyostelium purpureum TaxID=5786 RepID=F1A345_DICPU|nr:uncharacterized protein DICPUDRAFT_159040 [Dictyostelium purpureum]EGC29388.1 hypothetical protein DICPUDRAFT_159040 [Dictyostelium purpureum]|eukprot:XP_003294089.1 hypothetical protein DICPUDRAFT_159040 [Dictyostelium purpureum]